MITCINCGSNKTYISKVQTKTKGLTLHPHWYHYKDDYICHKCRLKLIDNPKWNTINVPRLMKWTPTGKQILLKERRIKGICSLCSNNIHDGSCKRTNLHHLQYHKNDPLKDTIELCASCHTKLHRSGF